MTQRAALAGMLALAGALVVVAPGGQARDATPAAAAAPATPVVAPRVLVDDFEDPAAWKAQPAEGVELAIGSDAGVHGKSLRLDVNFKRGAGYAVAHRTVSLDLPANYRFHFAVKGDIPPEDLEFKLIDSTGANVWWMNRRMFDYPAQWDSLITRKRQIQFAWGPAGGGEIRHVSAIEFAITAGKGGHGTVWLDDMTLEPLPPADAPPPPVVRTLTADGLVLDFGADRELSGIGLDWPRPAADARPPARFAVETSDDGARWKLVREALAPPDGHNEIHMPETATRYVRLRPVGAGSVAASVRAALRGIKLIIHPWDWAPTTNDFFMRTAERAPRGAYPRSYLGEQCYWTILGDDPGDDEVLIDEDGRIEPWKGGPSIEPVFVPREGPPVTWASGRTDARLGVDPLWTTMPIAEVTRDWGPASLTVRAFVLGADSAACLYVRYSLTAAERPVRGDLLLLVRPFQVNPPTQFLNGVGGACAIHRVVRAGDFLHIDARPPVHLYTPPDEFASRPLDAGAAVEALAATPREASSLARDSGAENDPAGFASGVLRYAVDVEPRATWGIDLIVPLSDARAPELRYDDAWRRARTHWGPLKIAGIRFPDLDQYAILKSQLAWALLTKDGPVLKPGARSYDRSWIRDGALSAEAFLRAGEPQVAKDFARWYAQWVPDDGAVPCCVDARGPDPTPEHDSHGEFIFLVGEIVRYTGDVALADSLWPAVRRAALHIDALREQERTAEYRTPSNAPYFGLLPPSISHEGYSAKPMHSYWDDLWALRGLRDAADLARRLGHDAEARAFAASRDTFAADLARSIRTAMAAHGVDYVPGCADLGDFDATSTTIALDPVEARDVLPDSALERTFERYWRFFLARRDSGAAWDAYTPYELRTVGAMCRLGWRDRAVQALEWFEQGMRPPGFRAWAEVVDREPRHARFIGDLPHTWVGTDAVRSMLDLFAYVPEPGGAGDSSLVIGAGVPWKWLEAAGRDGVGVMALPTPFGPLGYDMKRVGDALEVTLAAGLRVPAGGVRVWPPSPPARPAGRGGGAWKAATIDGEAAPLEADGSVVVRAVPAQVTFR